MTWFRVDDTLATHPKARRAGLPAMGLWAVSGAYSMQHLTEGFVPEWYVAGWPSGRKLAAQLVAANLWFPSERDGEPGWAFHQWNERQPSKKEVEEQRAENRERQAKFRAKKKQERNARNAESNGVTNAVTNAGGNGVRNAGGNGSPTQPSPAHPKTRVPNDKSFGSAEADSTAQTYVAEWLEHCPERPPGRVVSHVAKEVKGLVADGVAPNAIRAGLAAWHRKKLHPSTLASVVFEHQQSRLSVVTDSNGEPVLPPPFTKDWV